MAYIKKNILVKWSLISLFIAIVTGFITEQKSFLLSAENGLFISGLFVLMVGLFRCVLNGGLFDLFIYSYQKSRRFLKRNFEDELDTPSIGSFFEFRDKKTKNNNFQVPLLVGSLYILLSILLMSMRLFLF